jgi:hypothetical protein
LLSVNYFLGYYITCSSTATGAFELPEAGRDIDPAQWIVSSQNEQEAHHVHESVAKQTESSVDRYIRQNRNFASSVTVTSTLTTYSVSYSTISKTVTNLAAAAALSCLPSGFTMC